MSTSRFLRSLPCQKFDKERKVWLCRWCRKPCPKHRRSWCSDACETEYYIRTSPAAVRSHLRQRDKEICAVCGFDCAAAHSAWERLRDQDGNAQFDFAVQNMARAALEQFRAYLCSLGFDRRGQTCSGFWWQADHIKPVVEGGGECGLDNFRTLCSPCHKKETKKLAWRRAEARRFERQPLLHGL